MILLISQLINAIFKHKPIYSSTWIQNSIYQKFNWNTINKPTDIKGIKLILAAGIIEYFCDKNNIEYPLWTSKVKISKKLIIINNSDNCCKKETPIQLRKRNIYISKEYLNDKI